MDSYTPYISDDRRVNVDSLPVRGEKVCLRPPTAGDFDKVETAVKSDPTMSDVKAMWVILSQLWVGQDKLTWEKYSQFEYEDVEVLGKALRLFRAYSNLGL